MGETAIQYRWSLKSAEMLLVPHSMALARGKSQIAYAAYPPRAVNHDLQTG